MALYVTSTQRQYWLLSEREIARRRHSAEQVALERLRSEAERRHGGGEGGEAAQGRDALDAEEERVLRCYHERRILRLMRHMRFPTKTAATAIVYLKRFYIDHSVMEFNPSVTALSAMYAACKVEETMLDADALASAADSYDIDAPKDGDGVGSAAMRVSSETVLSVELRFFDALKFQLICFHPYRSLDAIAEFPWGDIFARKATSLVEQGAAPSAVKRVSNRARELVSDVVLFTDAPLTHTPAIVALGALLEAAAADAAAEPPPEAAERAGDAPPPPIKDSVRAFVAELCEREAPQSGDRLAQTMKQVETVRAMMSAVRPVIAAASGLPLVRELERRRHRCANLEHDPHSEVYKQNEATMAKVREERQAEKARRQERRAARDRAELTGVGWEPGSEGEPIVNPRKRGRLSTN